MVEHAAVNRGVEGSSPSSGANSYCRPDEPEKNAYWIRGEVIDCSASEDSVSSALHES